MNYINIFFIYSFLGHILEKILNPDHVSGILYGFWTPIYGVGSLIIIYTYERFIKPLKIKKLYKFILTFLIGFLLLSTIEFIGGFLIEKIFHITFWDYSDKKLNIGKYAAVEMGLIWGIASIILIYIIQPIVNKIATKTPRWATLSLIGLFFLDIIITVLLRAK